MYLRFFKCLILMLAFQMGQANAQLSNTYKKQFLHFRESVYQNKLPEIKKHLHFPLQANDLGYKLNTEQPIDLITEELFNAKYHKLFDQTFIEALLKIKSETLFEKGNFHCKPFALNGLQCTLEATFDKTSKELVINIYQETWIAIKGEDNKMIKEKTEYSEIYFFEFDPSGNLFFKKMMAAG